MQVAIRSNNQEKVRGTRPPRKCCPAAILEQDDMPTENHGARAVPEREPSKDSRRPTPPSPPAPPPRAKRPADLGRWPGIAAQQPLLIAPLGASLRLVDIPEDRRGRAVEHAGQRFSPGARDQELAERNIGHLVIGFLLDVGGDLLLLFR